MKPHIDCKQFICGFTHKLGHVILGSDLVLMSRFKYLDYLSCMKMIV